jgi:hypothetical protein
MPIAIVAQRVANYDEWRPYFDRYENKRLAHGISNARVFRNTDDPNDLVLWFDVADESVVNFADSDEQLRDIMQQAGVHTSAVSIRILAA